MAQCGDGVADSLDGLLDAFGNCTTRPFDFGGSLAVAASESDGGGEVLRDRVHLVMGFGRAGGIVELFGFFLLLPQLVEPAFVFGFGLCVQNWAAVLMRAFARIGCRSRGWRFQQAGEQFADVELAPWRPKQAGEALQAARGFQNGGVAMIPNRPVVVLMNKGRFRLRMAPQISNPCYAATSPIWAK